MRRWLIIVAIYSCCLAETARAQSSAAILSSSNDTTFTATGNPVIRHKFTADSAAMVYNNTVYLYTGHDEAPVKRNGYEMHNWLCFSSTDMKTWKEHPSPLPRCFNTVPMKFAGSLHGV